MTCLRGGALATSVLLLSAVVGCGDDAPPSGSVGSDAAVEDAQRELADLPGVDEATIERWLEDTEQYYVSLHIAMAEDADEGEVAEVLERAEELVADRLTDEDTGLADGSLVLDDPDADDPESPSSLTVGIDDGVAASERTQRIFVAMSHFDHAVSVTGDALSVNLDGEPVDAVGSAWRDLTADPVLGKVQQVALHTEAGTGPISDFSLSSSFGADEETLRVWESAVSILENAPDGIRPTGLLFYRADQDVFPTSRLQTEVQVGSRPPGWVPPTDDGAVRRLVLDFFDILDLLESDSSFSMGTQVNNEFVQVYTGSRLADDPANGQGGWPAFAREHLRRD